jgi:hypothetical protein
MFCHPTCQSTYGYPVQGFCGVKSRYNSQLSSTSLNLNKEWREQVDEFSPMYGEWMQDRLAIFDLNDEELSLNNFKFVSGQRMDIRFFKMGILGSFESLCKRNLNKCFVF